MTRPCAEVASVPRRGFTILRTFLDFLMRKMKSKEKCIFPEKADDIEKGRVVRPFFLLNRVVSVAQPVLRVDVVVVSIL